MESPENFTPSLSMRIRKNNKRKYKSKGKVEVKIICFCPKRSGNQQELNSETAHSQ